MTTYEEIKAAVMSLSHMEQRRLIVEVLPAIWPMACVDDNCVASVRELVDEATIREYRQKHLGNI